MIDSLLTHLPDLVIALQDGAGGAEGAPGGEAAPGLFGNPLLMIAIMIAIFWFVVIAPDKKKRKEHQAMLDALSKGDQVMTTSGMFGKIVEAKEDVIVLQVADGVRLRFTRAAIQGRIEPEGGSKKDAKSTQDAQDTGADSSEGDAAKQAG